MSLPGTPWETAENASAVKDSAGNVIAKTARAGSAAHVPGIAHAMAAAPDLARALEGLMAAEGGEPGDTPGQKRAWESALTALKKYRGEGT